MKFTEWLDSEVGRLKKVAKKFDVTPSAVSQWRTNGVPKEHMIPLRDFTKGKVSLQEMLEESHGK